MLYSLSMNISITIWCSSFLKHMLFFFLPFSFLPRYVAILRGSVFKIGWIRIDWKVLYITSKHVEVDSRISFWNILFWQIINNVDKCLNANVQSYCINIRVTITCIVLNKDEKIFTVDLIVTKIFFTNITKSTHKYYPVLF